MYVYDTRPRRVASSRVRNVKEKRNETSFQTSNDQDSRSSTKVRSVKISSAWDWLGVFGKRGFLCGFSAQTDTKGCMYFGKGPLGLPQKPGLNFIVTWEF